MCAYLYIHKYAQYTCIYYVNKKTVIRLTALVLIYKQVEIAFEVLLCPLYGVNKYKGVPSDRVLAQYQTDLPCD